MIDLIIPYYNNPEGLARTLDSINTDVFYVTVIDDHSNIPFNFHPNIDQAMRYNVNHGPGFARQFGLDRTYNSYVMFIDTGDVFLSKEIQEIILQTVEDDQYKNDMFCFQYYYKDQLTNESDNRMHGKVYKREFLQKYNITFCPESSYMDEDIGFNRTCRLLQNEMTFIDIPVIKWITDENSLTQKDKQIALYKDQTRALSLVSIHTIETCRKNNIDAAIERDQIAIYLYYWFVRCAAERPEFLKESWAGAKIFYDYFKDEIDPKNLWIGSSAIKKALHYKNQIGFPINILRFVHDIRDNENLPNYYLTKV